MQDFVHQQYVSRCTTSKTAKQLKARWSPRWWRVVASCRWIFVEKTADGSLLDGLVVGVPFLFGAFQPSVKTKFFYDIYYRWWFSNMFFKTNPWLAEIIQFDDAYFSKLLVAKKPSTETFRQFLSVGWDSLESYKVFMPNIPQSPPGWDHEFFSHKYLGVSTNSGTPKWMLYNGNPY